MPPQTALIEFRSWRVECRRRLVIECKRETVVYADDEVGSARAAEAEIRDRGWTIHADGSASCPVCVAVIDGTSALTVRGSITDVDDLCERFEIADDGVEGLAPDPFLVGGEVYEDGRWDVWEDASIGHPVEAAIREIAEIDQGEEANDE